MATELERLTVLLEAQTKQFENAMKRVDRLTRDVSARSERSLGNIDKALTKVSKNATNFAKGFALGAVTTAIGSLGLMATTAISTAAAIGDLSDKIGLGTDRLQALQYGAVQADMSFEDMEKTLLKASKSFAEAANGQGDYLKTLRANGQELEGTFLGNLKQLADLVANAKDEQEALLIITQAMGGADGWLEVLKKGSAGLDELGAAAARAGGQIEEELIRQAQELDDRWAALMLSLSQQTKSAVLTIVSELQKLDKAVPGPYQLGQMAGNWIERNVFGVAPPDYSNETIKPAPGAGSVMPKAGSPTKLFNPETAAAQEKARRDAKREADREAEAIADVIEQLQFEQKQLQASELTQEINNQLRQAGVSATSAQGQQIAALVTKNFELAQSEEMAKEAGEQWLEAQEALRDSLQDLAQLGLDAFESWIAGGEKLTDVLEDVARQLAKAAVQAALFGQGPLAGLFGTAGGGGLFGGLFKQAGGGNLHTGRPTLVGERGPELMVPRSSGYIVPNSGLRGMGGGGQFTIIDQRRGGEKLTPQKDSRGNPLLIIRDLVRSEIPSYLGSDQGSKFMQGRFGLNPSLARR